MDVKDLREFATRERAEARHLKDDYWAEEYRRSGGLATFAIGQRLFEHMRCIRPDWPSEDERAADLAHHVELKRRLALTANVLASR